MKKNHLYQFQVHNPYDGCWWCWAYAYVPEDGRVHFLKFDAERKWTHKLREYTERSRDGSYGISFNTERACKRDLLESLRTKKDLFIYDLANHKQTQDFIKNTHEHDVVGIAKRLLDTHGIELSTECSTCGLVHPLATFQSTGYHGDGGIGVVLTDFICEECYCLGLCSACGEYSENTRYFESEGEAYCEYCRPNTCKICGAEGADLQTNEDGVCPDCVSSPEYLAYLERVSLFHAERKYQTYFPDCNQIISPSIS